MALATRLPNVRSLTNILPSGAESGKEFARIVDLLLFQDARRRSANISLLDDSAGDYLGLDSFETEHEQISSGYQYKFYSSPLTDDHRSAIALALDRVAATKKKNRPKKWILVTPEDFSNSARRAGHGDIEWFESLRSRYSRKLSIEHYGHTKLLALFLEAPWLCLFYYPELVHEGHNRRRSIADTRATYNENLRSLFGKIEFVGMSVLKEEASRRIALEHIYIPVGLVQLQSEEEVEETPRISPIQLLAPGDRTVVLGDPGSGKSTLLKFLALCGTSPKLQERYQAPSDSRIPLIVALRRYADELKGNPNLPLSEYLKQLLRADFSLPDLNDDFLNYYLESGQAILLFDGLDELPNSSFRITVRDRIQTFSNVFPRNTVIVTSRIVGYDAETQFEGATFSHYRLAKLRIPEIEQFIQDWYSVRLENQKERTENATDLVRIIEQPGNEAIRDLARNPLLLTIVALVHRIDAILPDERVVLYQKCTETLLNTWHQTKYRQDEDRAKVRIERRNRHRIEAIAFWMHQRNTETGKGRAVVSFDDLLGFLTKFIESHEPQRGNEPSEDQAEEFLDFIRKRAGLIIESGDGLYSFVHLTFQEYLTATHLITQAERDGISSIWTQIGDQIGTPRWHEVVRLLVASLKSDESQRFLVEHLLGSGIAASDRDMLLAGLLVDGIGPAEEHEVEISDRAIELTRHAKSPKDLSDVLGLIRAWIPKEQRNFELLERNLAKKISQASRSSKLRYELVAASFELYKIFDNAPLASDDEARERLFLRVLTQVQANDGSEWEGLDGLLSMLNALSLDNPLSNAGAVCGLVIPVKCLPDSFGKCLFQRELVILESSAWGPKRDHGLNLVSLAINSNYSVPQQMIKAAKQSLSNPNRESRRTKDLRAAFKSIGRLERKGGGRLAKWSDVPNSMRHRQIVDMDQYHSKLLNQVEPNTLLQLLSSAEFLTVGLIPVVLSVLNLKPAPHWREALRLVLARIIPDTLGELLSPTYWKPKLALSGAELNLNDVYVLAWLLLLDIWVYDQGGFDTPIDSPFAEIATFAEGSSELPLKVSLAIRNYALKLISDSELEALGLESSTNRGRRVLKLP